MQLTQIVKYVLPPIVVDPARWLLARWPLRAPETGHVSIHYKLVSEWTTAKEGTGTFDFEVAKRSVDWELGVPVVRDNLEALGLINALKPNCWISGVGMDTISRFFPLAPIPPNGTISVWTLG